MRRNISQKQVNYLKKKKNDCLFCSNLEASVGCYPGHFRCKASSHLIIFSTCYSNFVYHCGNCELKHVFSHCCFPCLFVCLFVFFQTSINSSQVIDSLEIREFWCCLSPFPVAPREKLASNTFPYVYEGLTVIAGKYQFIQKWSVICCRTTC